MKRTVKMIIAAIFFAILGGIAVTAIYYSGLHFAGTNTMGYLYKSNLVFDAIIHGNLYPVFDLNWFAGMEQLRYTAPIPVFLLVICQFLTGGSTVYSYLLMVGLCVFLGEMIWFRLGLSYQRGLLGGVLGVIWMLMPPCLSVLFVEGDFGKLLCLLILPVLFDCIAKYYLTSKIKYLIGIMGSTALIALSSVEFIVTTAIGMGICIFFFTLFYRSLRKALHVALALLFGNMWAGFWLFAALQRVYVRKENMESLGRKFTQLLTAFNPISCLLDGYAVGTYLGISLVILAVFGLLFCRKKSVPGFISGITMLLCTSVMAMPFLMLMPFRNQLGMLRYVPVAATAIMVSFLMWKSLKRPFVLIVCGLLIIDLLPGIYSYRDISGFSNKAKCEKDYLLAEAKDITNQKLLMLDSGEAGSMAGFLMSTGNKKIPVIMGYNWDDSGIAVNYLQLCDALENGKYTYIFDRAIELGADSVLVKADALQKEEMASLNTAANRLEYQLIASNDISRLYHRDFGGLNGVVSKYPAIGIGTATRNISLDFPCMEETMDPNLSNYTYDELSKYRLIYLDGFTYTDKYMAETMIKRLSENGVHIVIAADGIPTDEHTGIQGFLDATCANVRFSNGFPELETIDGLLYPALFPQGMEDWKTVYINGLRDVWGSFWMDQQKLNFYGTVYNDNIVMIGLNLTYHYGLTKDEAIGALLSHAMDLDGFELPERRLVPAEIVVGNHFIQIETGEDNVNTTLAYHDIFRSAQSVQNRNYLTHVNKGRTIINLSIPFWLEGLATTIVGLFFSFVLCWIIHTLNERSSVEEIAITGIRNPGTGDIIKSGSEITVPQNAQYVIEAMGWYDAAGRILKEGERFPSGKNSIQISVRTIGRARFTDDVRILIDGAKVEQKTVGQRGVRITFEKAFQMDALFAFEKQPRSVKTVNQEAQTIHWKLSVPAKLGYIQKYNEQSEDWQIDGVVESQIGKVLSYEIPYSGEGTATYRLIYIMSNGTTAYSESFEVAWLNETEAAMENETEAVMENEAEAAEEVAMGTPVESATDEKSEVEAVAESKASAEDGAVAEKISKKEHKNKYSYGDEWTSLKEDYDLSSYGIESDEWYEELSRKNEIRFSSKH